MATLPVKVYSYTQPGAPVLVASAGSLLALIKACMVDGFGLKTCDSVTAVSGIATANFSTGHSFIVGSPALFAGASPAGLNGEFRVLTVGTNTVTFACPGVVDGTATGSIAAKVAPAGWSELFGATNIGVFRSSSPESSQMCLRLDDTGTTTARVVGYETMTDANSGSGGFPQSAQMPGGPYWYKANTVSATPTPWEIFADDRGFYLSTAPFFAAGASYVGRSLVYFGDFQSQKSGDAFGALLLGYPDSSFTAVGGCLLRLSNPDASSAAYVPRSHTQIGGSVACGRFSPLLGVPTGGVDAAYSGATALCGTYPNAATNGLVVSPLLLLEGTTAATATWRGTFPGLWHSPQLIPSGTFATGDRVAAEGPLFGRTLVAVGGPPAVSALISAVGFIDATGPWR